MGTEYTRSESEGLPILTIRGRISVEDVEDFQTHLDQLGRDAGKFSIVDLTGCPFLASRAFPALFQASEGMKASSKTMLIACGPDLLRILKVLRLDTRMAVHEDRASCLKQASKDGADA